MKRNVDMLNGPIFPSIVRYTVPIMLTNLLQLLFNAADLVVVGQYCGSISVAAVSATGALTNLIVNLFIGLSVGAGVAVAHGLGGNDPEAVKKSIHTALPTALISGAILTVLGILFSEPLLKMMKTPDNVLPLAAVYMKIYFGGIVFSMLYNFCGSILRAAGDTKGPLNYLMIAGVINVILNILFVRAFHMNVAGVALATTISQGISAVLVVTALIRRTDACHLDLKQMHIYKGPLLKIIQIGLPAGIQGSLFSISNVMVQSSINSFNSDAIMSANGAASNIDSFIYMTLNSFHQTAINFIGQNAAAHQYKRVKKVFIQCCLCAVVLGVALSMLVYTFGETLLSIYITDSKEAISYGMIRFAYLSLPYFLCGIMDISTGALRGLGASLVPMIISVLGICVFRIVWIYTIFQIPQYHTLGCLYLTYPLSWILTLVPQTLIFFRTYRKQQRLSTT